ncbi:hypothetical protein ACIBG4_36010 [Nonomuraea sp. NPDC050383]|uniref:hypothetical protein n=1 Tax=Nonomuraea sp. NPDC050383 TaxID=3364362 RepID=UPI0037AE758D
MSQRRSGLLSGLIVGFVAMIIGAAGYAAMATFYYRLPYEVRWFAGDPTFAFPVACCLLAGLILGLAMWTVRPRSLLLPLLLVLYAFGVRAIGGVAGSMGFVVERGFPLSSVDEQLVFGAQGVWLAIRSSWHFWAAVAAAAVPAFLLSLVRVVRVRRRWRAEDGAASHRRRGGGEPVADATEPEPEYRAPFEPLQPPKPAPTATTANLFTPRDPAQD